MSAPFKGILAGVTRRYGLAVAVVALALLLRWLFAPLLGNAGPHIFFLTAVTISAWYGGLGPGTIATLLATLAGMYLVLPQSWPLYIAAGGDRLQLGLLLVEGLILSALISALHMRLRRAEDALRERDDLLAVAAHELKTPLTTIIGYTQTLQVRAAREGHLNRRDQDTLRVIAAQAKRLQRLIDSLLDLARLHGRQLSIAPQVIDLVALAQRIVDVARLTATRHSVECNEPDAPLLIVGDPLRLEQVLENLVQNAIKYSPAGGRISVRVERQGNQATLCVSDQGIGVPEEARDQLFERFYRASNLDPRRIPGAGLGLAVVHEIVALHGGEVEVDSAEGQGSTFTVRLPLPEAHITAQWPTSIDRRQSVPLALPTRQIDRPAAEQYQEHVH